MMVMTPKICLDNEDCCLVSLGAQWMNFLNQFNRKNTHEVKDEG